MLFTDTLFIGIAFFLLLGAIYTDAILLYNKFTFRLNGALQFKISSYIVIWSNKFLTWNMCVFLISFLLHVADLL